VTRKIHLLLLNMNESTPAPQKNSKGDKNFVLFFHSVDTLVSNLADVCSRIGLPNLVSFCWCTVQPAILFACFISEM